MAEWSELPNDIIEMIGIRLEAVEDFLAFSAVCHSWRSFYLIKKWVPAGAQVPLLMLSDNENSSKRGFDSLCRDKEYEVELGEASGRRCWGSSDGWLVTIASDRQIHLLNAFTKVRIQLPSANTFQILFNSVVEWYQYIDKAVVVDGEEHLVVAIYGPFHQLAFAKPGYSSWISVEDSSSHRFMDVACVNDQIFAVSAIGTLLLVEIRSPSQLQEIVQANTPAHRWACERRYLAESAGDLLMVYQYIYAGYANHHPVEPIQFRVFKFDFVDKEWIEVRDLGDRALFLGDNACVSAKASRSNSIYFIGSKVENRWRFDEHFVYRDSGVYNMADGTVEPFYFGADYPSYYSCPIWLTPKLVYDTPGH